MPKGFKNVGDGLMVSRKGLIWSERSHKFLKTSDRAQVAYRGGHVLGYHLIAQAFCDRPAGTTVVHHINGDYNDNRAKNLMWVTPEQHAAIHAEWHKLLKEVMHEKTYQEIILRKALE